MNQQKENKNEGLKGRRNITSITIVMTEMCNLACKYCYVCSENKTQKASVEVMDASVEFAKNYLLEHPDESIIFDIFGGEPLIAWKECQYLLERLKEQLVPEFQDRFVGSTIFTNLTLLNREHLDWIKAYNGGSVIEGLCRLSYSLDGCKEANDKSRVFKDGRGTYDVVMKKVELLKEYIPQEAIFFKSVISPENVEYLMQTVKEFNELKIGRISMGPARTNSWTEESIKIYDKSITELADYYIEHINDGLFYDIFAIPVLDYEKNKQKWGFCGAGKNMLSISPEGDIYPCQRFYNSRSPYIFGNVLTGGIDKNNKWYNLFNNYSLSNMVGCSKCKKFTHYNCPYGSCMATNYEESKNIFIKSDMTCKILEITTREAFRVHEALKDNVYYQRTLDRRKYGG